MVTRIVERFPRYRSQVLDALGRDGVMAELCEDYDRVVAALESEEAVIDSDKGKRPETYRELVRLKRELEYELLERLATSEEPERIG